MKGKYIIFSVFFVAFSTGVYFYGGNRNIANHTPYGESSDRVPSSKNDRILTVKLPEQNKKTIQSLNSLILNMKEKKDVSKVIETIVAMDEKTNPSQGEKRQINDEVLRLYAIASDFVKYLEGGIYRMRHIVEPAIPYYGPMIMTLRQTYRVRDQWPDYMTAVFHYLTDPNPGKDILGVKKPFTKVSELQNFLARNLAPIIKQKNIEILEVANLNNLEDRNILALDPALVYGREKYQKIANHLDSDEFQQLSKVVTGWQLKQGSAYIDYALGNIFYYCSYNLEKYEQILNDVAMRLARANSTRKAMIRNGDFIAWNDLPEPNIRKKFLDDLKSENQKFGTVREAAIKEDYLSKSHEHFLNGSMREQKYFKKLFSLVDQLENPKYYLVNPNEVKNYKAIINDQLDVRVKAFGSEGAVDIQDRITGESYLVNIKAFFDHEKMSDLTKFYPNVFYGSVKGQSKREIVNAGDKDTYEWNYNFGKALSWPDPTFGGVLPNAINTTYKRNGSIEIKGNVIDHIFHLNQQLSVPLVAGWLDMYQ